MVELFACACQRNASLARKLAQATPYARATYSANEVPAGQEYKTELVELVGETSGVADCRYVGRAMGGARAIWRAQEIAGFVDPDPRPAILKWLPEAAVRRFHALTPDGKLVRHYGYDTERFTLAAQMLVSDPETKRCVVSFQRPEYVEPAAETPCAVATQYLLRGGALWALNSYRSHDFFAGGVTDPIRHSLVQQAMAHAVGARPGPIVFQEGSMHYYPKRATNGALSTMMAVHDDSYFPCEMDLSRTASDDLWADLQLFAAFFRDGPESPADRTGNAALDHVMLTAKQAWLDRRAP